MSDSGQSIPKSKSQNSNKSIVVGVLLSFAGSCYLFILAIDPNHLSVWIFSILVAIFVWKGAFDSFTRRKRSLTNLGIYAVAIPMAFWGIYPLLHHHVMQRSLLGVSGFLMLGLAGIVLGFAALLIVEFSDDVFL